MRARETSCWRSSSVRTAIMSIFKRRRTWFLMNLWSLSSSSLNLFNPDITKSASLPMSFFPLQRGPLGLPSWYSLKPHNLLHWNGLEGINGVEASLMGLLLLVDTNSPRYTEAKRRISHFFMKQRLAITLEKYQKNGAREEGGYANTHMRD